MRVEIVSKDLSRYFQLHVDVDVYLFEMIEAGADDANVDYSVVGERGLVNFVDRAHALYMQLVDRCSEENESNVGNIVN